MKLTALLFGKRPPLRRLFSGKHRLPRVIGLSNKRAVLYDLAREEENLFLLRQPYLTHEQEKIWIAKEAEEALQVRANKLNQISAKKMYKSVTYEERLEHLRTIEAWE